MSGVVVWITGLPSSGKSTLARALAERLAQRGVPCCLFDGDEVRAALVPRPGYDEASRDDFYATLGNLAALAARSSLVVLVAATSHRAEYRRRARAVAPAFVEVFIDVPREVAARRDAKGLYRAVAAGRERGLPGADLVYERPAAPEVALGGTDDEAALGRLLRLIEATR
ncbi:MAG: adenylyl-sulfate kinase [Sorangiineae bacterium]|nr:adenylyl-sulfate kinase [Polyangiaceae bacterium]MEB2321031.1 adenylyl-sulfate kinase [Sorangiineae bacterium]